MTLYIVQRTKDNIIRASRISDVLKLDANKERETVTIYVKATPEQHPLICWGVTLTGVVELESL